MKNQKSGNMTKIIAATIIGIMLIMMVGIVANGWQTELSGENSGEDSNITVNADNPNGDTEDNNGTADNYNKNENSGNIYENPPEFISYLTGLEIPEELDSKLPFAIVIEPNAPLYGISGSELAIEVPVEDGNTRFLIYRTDTSSLGKIGAVTATRNYLSQIVKFFGGILVAYGSDDIISYSSIPSTVYIDLSKNTDSIYKENGKNIYTDNQKLAEITKNEGIDLTSYKTQLIPYDFCDSGKTVLGKAVAKNIYIPYSETNETVFEYDSINKKYLLSKDGRNKVDMLDGNTVSFKNLFVLFSDMITYEMSSGTQTIVETATKGTGYYVTNGTLTEIRWEADSEGQLIFKDLNGKKLVANRGNTYIGYYKSSDSNAVIFE